MAIQIPTVTVAETGIQLTDVYVRIDQITADKDKAGILVSAYVSKAARISGGVRPVYTRYIQVPATADLVLTGGLIAGGYSWLKANVEEYENAIDV